jgi:hypothetical protein
MTSKPHAIILLVPTGSLNSFFHLFVWDEPAFCNLSVLINQQKELLGILKVSTGEPETQSEFSKAREGAN